VDEIVLLGAVIYCISPACPREDHLYLDALVYLILGVIGDGVEEQQKASAEMGDIPAPLYVEMFLHNKKLSQKKGSVRTQRRPCAVRLTVRDFVQFTPKCAVNFCR
jgi:hypothetical protein